MLSAIFTKGEIICNRDLLISQNKVFSIARWAALFSLTHHTSYDGSLVCPIYQLLGIFTHHPNISVMFLHDKRWIPEAISRQLVPHLQSSLVFLKYVLEIFSNETHTILRSYIFLPSLN
jgi:hypothetical protein